jgi:hypothetical protein
MGHPDYTLWLAASGHGGDTFAAAPETAAYAWSIETNESERLSERDTAFKPTINDCHMAAVLNAAVEALDCGMIAPGSSLHVITDLDRFVRMLNEDRSVRRLNDYRRRSINRPLPYAEKWRELDALLDRLSLKVSARRPWSAESKGKAVGRALQQ